MLKCVTRLMGRSSKSAMFDGVEERLILSFSESNRLERKSPKAPADLWRLIF